MNKQLLFLSVVCFLCTNVFGQYFIYYTEMTGDQMTPPVNSQRTATLTLSFLPGVGGVTVLYSFLDNSIVDKTVLSLYAPTPSDPAALLVDKPNPTQNGQAIIPLAGSENNYTVIINYINSINALFSLGYAHAILRTSAFPNGELRGDFSGVNYRRDQFYGATVFPFPQTLVERHVVFISCEGVLNSGTSSCQWSSSLPVGGSIELQGPNGLLLPLSASSFIVVPPTPGLFGRGTFVIPASLTVAQFIDLGNRGELRLSYKIGGAEVGSTALSILGKPPTLEAKLNGSNVVPPVTTNATGTATRIFEEFQTLSLSHSVSGAKRFTLHSGEAGVNGEEVYDYLTGISPIPNDFQYTTSSYVVNEFSNPQKYYVTVSSDAYPNGEIRGQFAVFPSNEFSDTLSGQKVVPAVTSQLSGNALLRYDSILEALYVNITSTSTSTTAVLLRGPADSSSTGPILATLCSFKCNLRRIFFGVLKKDSQGFASGQTLASVVEVLLQGKAYVELQTTQNPSGELRANLVPSINNNPPGIPTQEFTFSGRPDIDLVTVPPTPVPSIPTFFRRRRRAQ